MVSMGFPPLRCCFANGKPAKIAHEHGHEAVIGNFFAQGFNTRRAVENTNLGPCFFHVLDILFLQFQRQPAAPLFLLHSPLRREGRDSGEDRIFCLPGNMYPDRKPALSWPKERATINITSLCEEGLG